MPNNFPILVGGAAPEPTTGDYLVRFIDFDGTILKEQWVNAGQAATAPTPPMHQYLTFDEWNNTFTNIQHDLDVGATYYTTDGKTYLFCRFNARTGLQPTLNLNKASTSQMDIDWGDGTGASLSGSGNISLQKAAAYSNEGDYLIKITCAGNYSVHTSGYILGDNSTYTSALLKCYLGNNIVSLPNFAFQKCSSMQYITIPKAITNIGLAFAYCTSLYSITFPNAITAILTQTFYANHSLTVAVLSQNITAIGSAAFLYCYKLKDFVLPNNLAKAENSAFNYNYSLNIMKFPNATTVIENAAIAYQQGLTKIIFGSNVTTIGTLFLYYCFIVVDIRILTITPPSLAANAFLNISKVAKIYVPDESVNAYKAATNWIAVASYIYPISTAP